MNCFKFPPEFLVSSLALGEESSITANVGRVPEPTMWKVDSLFARSLSATGSQCAPHSPRESSNKKGTLFCHVPLNDSKVDDAVGMPGVGEHAAHSLDQRNGLATMPDLNQFAVFRLELD